MPLEINYETVNAAVSKGISHGRVLAQRTVENLDYIMRSYNEFHDYARRCDVRECEDKHDKSDVCINVIVAFVELLAQQKKKPRTIMKYVSDCFLLYKKDTGEDQPDRWQGMATNALQISIERQKPPRVRDGRPEAMNTTSLYDKDLMSAFDAGNAGSLGFVSDMNLMVFLHRCRVRAEHVDYVEVNDIVFCDFLPDSKFPGEVCLILEVSKHGISKSNRALSR